MLKPEEAKARLAKWRLPEGENRLKDEVSRLPKALRELAVEIFELSEDDDSTPTVDWFERQARKHRAVLQLDRQSAHDRGQVFATISPQLSPVLERTWQLLKTIPYQSGYQRKAFRAGA